VTTRISAVVRLISPRRLSPDNLVGASRYEAAPWLLVTWLALASIAVIILANFVSREVTRQGEFGLLLATLVTMVRIRRVDPGWWLYGALVAYALWMGVIDHFLSIAPERVNPEQYPRRYLKQYCFLLSGWWVGMRPRLGLWLLAGGVAGFAIGLVGLSDMDQWPQAWRGARVDFDFHNAQHTALYAMSCLFALGYLVTRAWGLRAAWMRYGAVFLASGGLLVGLFVLSATQTRQSWVALVAALIGVGVVILWCHRTSSAIAVWRVHRWKVMTIMLLALIAGVVFNPINGVWQRTQGELDNVAQLLSGKEPDNYSSITVRLSTWRVALEAIVERPLTGYGGGSNGIILNHSNLPQSLRDRFGHYHNSYLGSTIHYGLPGLVFWLLGPLYLLRRSLDAYQRSEISTAAMVMSVGWLFYFLTVNAFETYINYDSSWYVVLIMGGTIYAWTLRPRAHCPVKASVSASA